jgi:hypothetical protein
LSSNAEIIVRVLPVSAHNGDSYYVSAASDQGSNRIWFVNKNDIVKNGFPNVYRVNREIPFYSNILLITGITSAISFSITFFYRLSKDPKKRGKLLLKIVVIIPASVACSTILLISFEVLLRSEVVSSMFIPPLDITGTNSSTIIHSYNIQGYSIESAAVQNATALIVIILMARGAIAYITALFVIRRLYPVHPFDYPYTENPSEKRFAINAVKSLVKEIEDPNDVIGHLFESFKRYGKIKLFIYCILIMGIPIASIILLFFYESIGYLSLNSFLIIIFIVDIVRMALLLTIIPKRVINTIEI